MIVHATTDQLAAEPWLATPANAATLLWHASLLIDRCTVTAVYRTDDTGLALDQRVLTALADATCAQAATWAALGIDPTKGPADPGKGTATSKSIGSASITRDTATAAIAAAARADAATTLTPAAAQILTAARLLTSRAHAHGW